MPEGSENRRDAVLRLLSESCPDIHINEYERGRYTFSRKCKTCLYMFRGLNITIFSPFSLLYEWTSEERLLYRVMKCLITGPALKGSKRD